MCFMQASKIYKILYKSRYERLIESNKYTISQCAQKAKQYAQKYCNRYKIIKCNKIIKVR